MRAGRTATTAGASAAPWPDLAVNRSGMVVGNDSPYPLLRADALAHTPLRAGENAHETQECKEPDGFVARHARATGLINAGVPIPVVLRNLGHVAPAMAMHDARTLAVRAEREFQEPTAHARTSPAGDPRPHRGSREAGPAPGWPTRDSPSASPRWPARPG